MEEHELTYLAKYLPKNLKKFPSEETLDWYFPANIPHPVMRIRKQGDRKELTKKTPITGTDSSHQLEQTISLSAEEYAELIKLPTKKIHKMRYFYSEAGIVCEIDIFLDELEGLVTVDIEFDTREAMTHFIPPDFCGADVTQALFIAGGKLSGMSYEKLEPELKKYGYRKILSHS